MRNKNVSPLKDINAWLFIAAVLLQSACGQQKGAPSGRMDSTAGKAAETRDTIGPAGYAGRRGLDAASARPTDAAIVSPSVAHLAGGLLF